MALQRFGKKVVFPRNEHVDVHVREVTLNPEAPEGKQVHAIDIREFIKSGEVYGHGIVINRRNASDLKIALEQIAK